jgi:hypothetical protein
VFAKPKSLAKRFNELKDETEKFVADAKSEVDRIDQSVSDLLRQRNDVNYMKSIIETWK